MRNEQGYNFISGLYMLRANMRPASGPQKSGSQRPPHPVRKGDISLMGDPPYDGVFRQIAAVRRAPVKT